jgi:GxxExxY protein
VDDKAGLNELSRAIIASAFQVQNTLGAGFLEKVYENAVVYELRQAGLRVQLQHMVDVRCREIVAGSDTADHE